MDTNQLIIMTKNEARRYEGRVANVKIFQKIIFKISQIWQKSNKIIFANFR